MAEIIPFPYARRRGFLRKQASFLGGCRLDIAEKHLRAQLRVQRDTMEKRGIAAERVDAELRIAELAIRLGAEMGVPAGREGGVA